MMAPETLQCGHGSDVETLNDMEEQHQFPDKFQTLQISGRINSLLGVIDLDISGWGIREEMLEISPTHRNFSWEYKANEYVRSSVKSLKDKQQPPVY